MSDRDIDETIKEFLISQLEDVTDFGYLLISNEERVDDEALCNLKKKFKEFIEGQPPQTGGTQ